MTNNEIRRPNFALADENTQKRQESKEKYWTDFYNDKFQNLIQELGDSKLARAKLYESLSPSSKTGFEFEYDEQGNPTGVSRAYSYDAWCE